MRTGDVHRKTNETEVLVTVSLDGKGVGRAEVKPRFFAHMIDTLSTHSLLDIMVKGEGDLQHHLVEDVAICLGEAILKAMGDGAAIARFGYAMVPMDCSLAIASVDFSGRPYPKIDLKLRGQCIEDMRSEDILHFFETLSISMRSNVHLWIQYGNDDHHKAEAAVKALALALRQALSIDPRRVGAPSSKGVL